MGAAKRSQNPRRQSRRTCALQVVAFVTTGVIGRVLVDFATVAASVDTGYAGLLDVMSSMSVYSTFDNTLRKLESSGNHRARRDDRNLGARLRAAHEGAHPTPEFVNA